MTHLILPPLRRTARDAEAFARAVHADQVDKAGRPYVEHLERVARATQMKTYGLARLRKTNWSEIEADEALQIAWLHDVIEDTKANADDLRAEGFGRRVVDGVLALTRTEQHTTYLSWVRFVCIMAELPALLVKIADTEDNSDAERLAVLDEPTRSRLTAKYAASLPILRAAVEARG